MIGEQTPVEQAKIAPAVLKDCYITGKVKLMRELLKVLKDKGEGGRTGLGFNESSQLYIDSPEDSVLRFRGKPGKGRAPYINVVAMGLNVSKGEYTTFNPNWLWRYVKTGNADDNFSMYMYEGEKATISFSASGEHGFNVPLGISQRFDIDEFLKHKLFNEDLHMRIPFIRYEISMASFRVLLERVKIIHPKYFALYSIGGRLYIYVKARGDSYVDSVGVTGISMYRKGEIDKGLPMFDTYMAVSVDTFETIVRNFDQISVSLPVEPDSIKTFVIDAVRMVDMSSAITLTLASGRNLEFKDCPSIEQMKERLERGEIE